MLPRLRAVASWKNATGASTARRRCAASCGRPRWPRRPDLRRDARVARAAAAVRRALLVGALGPHRPAALPLGGAQPSERERVGRVGHRIRGSAHDCPPSCVHGVVTRRFTVDLVGAGRVTAAKFRPGGFARVHRRPARRATASRRLGRELGVDPARAAAAVLAEEDDDDRAAVLDAALAPLRARAAGPPTSTCSALVGAMIDDRALVRVDQVAALGGDERPVAAAAVRRLRRREPEGGAGALPAAGRRRGDRRRRGRRPGRAGRLAAAGSTRRTSAATSGPSSA